MKTYTLSTFFTAIVISSLSLSASFAESPQFKNLVLTSDTASASIIKVGKDKWLDDDDDGYVEEYSSHRKVEKDYHSYDEDAPYYKKKHRHRNGHRHDDYYSHNKYRKHYGHRHDHYHRPKYISKHNARRILNKHGFYRIYFVHGYLPVYKAKACKHGRHYHVWVNKWGHITKNKYVGYCSRYSRIRDFWLGRRRQHY